MTSQPFPSGPLPSRLYRLGEWIVVIGLAVTLAWTTLCLGGYLAKTMVATSWMVFGLTALGGMLWALQPGMAINRAVWLPVPFLLYALASVLWLAPARWLAWREWLLWFQMWLVFALALHFGRGRRQTWVMVGTFVGLGLAGVVMAAWQRFGDAGWMMLGRRQADQFFGRSAGMFGIPNSLAGLMELMIPVALALAFSRATKAAVKIVCGWLAVLFLFAVVLTGSRGGWIGLGLALMCWPLLGGHDWRKRIAGAALVLGLAAGGVTALYCFSDYAHERIQPFLEGRFESSRPIIWKAAVQIWRDHPWLGGGAASYNVLFDQHRPPGFLNEPDWTHNDYLNTLSDYGVVGFGLWAGAGAGLFWLSWRAVGRARRENALRTGIFDRWKWRLGLFVGLLAFGFHLAVDFHTKLPALAFASAVVMALLLRDDSLLRQPWPAGWRRLAGGTLVLTVLLIGWGLAAPVYQAEALRYDARRDFDRNAEGQGAPLKDILPGAIAKFRRAVKVYPANGQAWADLSYGLSLTVHVGATDLNAIGRRAELAADRALALCPVNAEFWIRKGVAMDMQSRQFEAEAYYLRAVELAPRNSAWWYYYAYHLQGFPKHEAEALRAVETCLALDPTNPAAVALREQLATNR